MTIGICGGIRKNASQQTFVLKSSWRRVSSSSSKDVLRRLDEDEYIIINHTSSEDVFKTSWSRPIYSSWPDVFQRSSRRLQNVFKTSWRLLQDIFKTFWRRLQDVFKTSSRRLGKISSRGFQGAPSSWFVLVNTSSRSIQHLSLYRGICLGNTTSEKFMVSVQNLQER